MKTHQIKHLLVALLVLATANLHPATARAQGTAFTYEGRLINNGTPTAGIYDFQFALYDAVSNGNAVGLVLTNSATAVNSNGLFMATLDFGANFPGTDRWLEIGVRTNGGGVFTTLNPRQKLLPAPYAITAGNLSGTLPAGQLTGALPLAQLPGAVLTNNENGVALTGAFTGNGGGLTNLPAASLTGTIDDAQLGTNVARLSIPNTTTQATGGLTITSGFITDAGVTNGGAGYTSAPLVAVTDASGSNAVITAAVSGGAVVGLTVQSAGSHYSAGTTLTIAPPPSNAFQIFGSGNVFNGVNTFNNPGNAFAGFFTGNGVNVTNLNAANLTGTAAGLAAGNLTLNSNVYLPTTTAGAGIIYSGSNTLLHAFGTQDFFAGVGAGNLTLTGAGQNVGVGFNALHNDTTGTANTGNGFEALFHNTTGNYNTANGWSALFSSTTANWNTANGYSALYFNTTGGESTANGFAALYHNTTGNFNSANGFEALYSNTTGNYNTANGANALYTNTTGIENVANGGWALYGNTTGSYNVANGEDALHLNTTGSQNTVNGWEALSNNATGSFNTANGASALLNNTNGSYNVAEGYQALYNNANGSNNIALGYQAGFGITTGSFNIDIGNAGLAADTGIIRIGAGQQTQAFIAGKITGDGSGLTNLNVGQLPAAVLTNNATGVTLDGTFGGTFTGSGGGLTNVSANAISGGITTNLLVGTFTFYITNGIIMNIQ